MKFPRNAKIFRGQLDAAPWACLFVLILTFFMLKSSFFFTPGIPLELPETPTRFGTTNVSEVVLVDANGRLFYGNQLVSSNRLKSVLEERVASHETPFSLIVQADRSTTLEAFAVLGDLARKAGIQEIILAARPAFRSE